MNIYYVSYFVYGKDGILHQQYQKIYSRSPSAARRVIDDMRKPEWVAVHLMTESEYKQELKKKD